jgi:hypothetical protein
MSSAEHNPHQQIRSSRTRSALKRGIPATLAMLAIAITTTPAVAIADTAPPAPKQTSHDLTITKTIDKASPILFK